MLKLLFAGTPQAAVPALRALVADSEHFEVVAVLTRPDAPQGRGRKLTASPVKEAALELGLPVIESDPKEPAFIAELAATGAEAAAVVAYGKILRAQVLEALPLGWFNLHFSLLPQWRGAAPVQRAIWAGDTITGASVFRITEGMDTGPIVAQLTVEIGAHETAGELLERLSHDGSTLLAAALEAVVQDQIIPSEQPQGAYEIAHKISVSDAHTRFDIPVFAVDRQIRACTPQPGAWCTVHTEVQTGIEEQNQEIMLHILKAAPASEEALSGEGVRVSSELMQLQPGAMRADKKHVWVGTATDPIELIVVKAQGKKAMNAADWARGVRLNEHTYCS